MLPEERSALEAAEALDLRLQQAHLFDQIVHRLTRQFATAVGWPESAIADVLEPSREITSNLRAITLSLNSRDLYGSVCFRISEPACVSSARSRRGRWLRQRRHAITGEKLVTWNRCSRASAF